ncbi:MULTISPECIES: hypothetical protein [Nocardiaceae]|uniref:hypothetical protein n=1 Tax=Nocardiaceae TaxID=85025 RepID=UPI00056349A9|nr:MULTISPECIES: hypothetical protein [Rhodococcus]OZD12071.1 hypothetical protein CH248_29155 [Rhodococcus sp. 06-156-4a]OZD15740.1 hypothetical protein CH253_22495 [Rhodococcus sp. 06-156-3C]OZD21124.1 hypothetical protein CH280_02725 [Rhodococcus sp. 06-156-4C]OZD32307.1 hypothetical protein CH284_20655 [Rhodococcus sp. 06-156-3]OZD36528.1 hypothetical protein CH247_03080 [Rhodococcus sp. 06-156-3b]
MRRDDLSESDRAELEILAQLCSPEAVAAFELMCCSVRVETAPRFVDLLRTVNALSGPGFAERASAELLEVVASTGEVELMARHSVGLDDPIGALALAQLIRTIADNRATLGEAFGL